MAEQQGPLVPIMPVPVVISIGTVRTRDGQPLVELTASTPIGRQTYFLEPDAAIQIADTIFDAAKQAKASALVVPGTADVIDINKNGNKDG